MGLFDFDIHDDTPEKHKLYDISADKGETWTTQRLTPTDVLQLRMQGYVTRSHYKDWKIIFYPGNSAYPVRMTIGVPSDRDAEEYIDEFLDGALNEFLRYNSEWEFQ